MDTSNWINLLAVIVAINAAFIAWRSMFAARNSADEANAIQERLLEIEEARESDRKAKLQPVRFETNFLSSMVSIIKLDVHNVGEETAYELRFFINREQVQGSVDELPSGESVTLTNLPIRSHESIYLHIKWINSQGVEKSDTRRLR